MNIKRTATGFMLLKKSALKRIEKDVDTFVATGREVKTQNYLIILIVM